MIKAFLSICKQVFINTFKGHRNGLNPQLTIEDSVLKLRNLLSLTVSDFPLQPIENGYRDIGKLTSDKAGHLWFLESITIMDSDSSQSFPKIGELSPTGQLTEFPIPGNENSVFNSIMAAPDGNIWFTSSPDYFTDSSSISTIDKLTHDGVVTEYQIPAGISAQSLIVGPDRNIWFSVIDATNADTSGINSGKIGRITPEGRIKIFNVSNAISINGIAKGVDGRIWFTADNQKPNASETRYAIGTITTGGHVEQRLLDKTYSYASSIAVGTDGSVYFQESKTSIPDQYDWVNGIGRIRPGGAISTIETMGNDGLTMGPDGNLWTKGSTDMGFGPAFLNRTTPSGIVTVFPDLGSDSIISMGKGNNGSLWFASSYDPVVIKRVSGLYNLTGALDTRGLPNYSYTSSSIDWPRFDNTSIQPHPRFAGIAHPGATVTLYAQPVGGTTSIFLGHTKTSRINGQWAIRSKPKLQDGSYLIMATESGSGQLPTLLSPFSDDFYAAFTDGPAPMPLLLDSKPPELTGVKLNYANRQFKVMVDAGESGLMQSPPDGTLRLMRPGQTKPIPISEHYSYDPNAIPEPASPITTITYDFIDKKPMPNGGYSLQIRKSALTDTAGNQLAKAFRINLR